MVDPEDLEGSALSEALAQSLNPGIIVAPTIGVNFIESWVIKGLNR